MEKHNIKFKETSREDELEFYSNIFLSEKRIEFKKIEEAKPLMKKMSDNYEKLLNYFPENTKEGFKTEALPSIWENKDAQFLIYRESDNSDFFRPATELSKLRELLLSTP